MTQPYSPELALAIACCRWPPSPERETAVREAAAGVADWELFDRLVVRHRITPLARNGLMCAGVSPSPAVEERLRARAADCAVMTLAMTRESVRLQRAFEAAGLPALIIKGVAVGIIAYGDACMKESWDIDLLTSPECVSEAHALLERLGYELYLPARMTTKQFRRLTGYTKDAGFRSVATGMTVELHWRTMENGQLLTDVSVHGPSQIVVAAGAQLRTFDDETLFAYLCVHGTKHAWARLKWLADLGAFIESRGTENLERFCEAALDVGVGRTVGPSLLLCSRLFGTSLPSSTVRKLGRGRTEAFLEAACLQYITQPTEPGGPAGLPPLRLFIANFLLAPGYGYLLTHLWSVWQSPLDGARFGPLAHLLRIPLWLGRVAYRTRNHLVTRVTARMSG